MNLGKRAKGGREPIIERHNVGQCVTRSVPVDHCHDHVLEVEANIQCLPSGEAATNRSGLDQEDKREGDLCEDSLAPCARWHNCAAVVGD
jgi:hypothetical protein